MQVCRGVRRSGERPFQSFVASILAILTTLFIAACSGGGGGEGGGFDVTSAPAADGVTSSLTGTSSRAGIAIASSRTASIAEVGDVAVTGTDGDVGCGMALSLSFSLCVCDCVTCRSEDKGKPSSVSAFSRCSCWVLSKTCCRRLTVAVA